MRRRSSTFTAAACVYLLIHCFCTEVSLCALTCTSAGRAHALKKEKTQQDILLVFFFYCVIFWQKLFKLRTFVPVVRNLSKKVRHDLYQSTEHPVRRACTKQTNKHLDSSPETLLQRFLKQFPAFKAVQKKLHCPSLYFYLQIPEKLFHACSLKTFLIAARVNNLLFYM